MMLSTQNRPSVVAKALTEAEPLISVIIPTYNNAHLLDEAIQSVLQQSYRHIEIIVVDDGSTDDPASVVRRYDPQDRKMVYVRTENSGNAAARNRGLVEATGEWICFLDADDTWDRQKLQRQLDDLNLHPETKISFTAARRVHSDGRVESMPTDPVGTPDLWQKLVFYQPFASSHSGLMVHRSCFEEVGYFDEKLKLSVDWDLFIRLADRFEIRSCPAVLVNHRKHGRNTTSNAELRLKMYLRCLQKHRRLFCLARGYRKEWHLSYCERLLAISRHLLKSRQWHSAWHYTVRLFRYGGFYQCDEKLKLLLESLAGILGLR